MASWMTGGISATMAVMRENSGTNTPRAMSAQMSPEASHGRTRLLSRR